ncbi:hypothetical protein ACI79P_13135 [Blastococcus sp. SYSU DS0510]
MPPEQAVIGIYRSFGRSARIAARVLRTLLEPATCHELTAASGQRAAAAPPERLTLVVDVCRLPHPQARQIAEAAGVPLVTGTMPAVPPIEECGGGAVDRGTRAARAIVLGGAPTRTAGARPAAARGGARTPASRSR